MERLEKLLVMAKHEGIDVIKLDRSISDMWPGRAKGFKRTTADILLSMTPSEFSKKRAGKDELIHDLALHAGFNLRKELRPVGIEDFASWWPELFTDKDAAREAEYFVTKPLHITDKEAGVYFILHKKPEPREICWEAREYIKIWNILKNPKDIHLSDQEFYITASETIKLNGKVWEDIIYESFANRDYSTADSSTYAYVDGEFFRLPPYKMSHLRHWLSPTSAPAELWEIESGLSIVTW